MENPSVPSNQPVYEPQEPIPTVVQPEPEKILYSWTAPSRLYKKRNREYFGIIMALVILISIILLFAKEFLLIAVILSFLFLTYVLASVQPDNVKHTLTNRGIRTDTKLHPWTDCIRYWWEDKWGQPMVHLQTPQFPHKVILLVGAGDKKEIETILDKYVIKEKPEPTWIDRAATWLQEKVPLESDDQPTSFPPSPPTPPSPPNPPQT
jgi:hypothetical protein